MLARPCRSCNPKNISPHRCGPAMQAPTSKRQGLCKNSIALSKFHRNGEHCSPALAAAATPKIFPRTVGGPARQAPTSKRQGSRKISIALSKFHRRGEHCSPALAAAATQKIFPRTVGGPAMQAPTSKRQGSRKNSFALSKFHRRGGALLRPPLAAPAALKKSPPHPGAPPCPRTQNAHFAAKMKIP